MRAWVLGAADGVPDAIAPFSQAVAHGDVLHVTGQMPIDPSTGALVPGGVREQTDQVLRNLAQVLQHCGTSLDAVVCVRAYLTSFDDYAAFNAAYAAWFREPYPARTCIGVTGLALGALVEIDLTATRDGTTR
ncbi:MAG TPA: Rid family detoxifying hydrolase [Mycobacteriales bacterium]|nr:Rid family detoxifying hydrolase [Mycobacteriales bacterium]